MEFTNGYGVDVIIDPVGAKAWDDSYKLLSPMGKLIVYGNQNLVTGKTRSLFAMVKEFINMPKIKPFHMIGSNKAIMGYHLGRMQGAEEKITRSVMALNELGKNGHISPIIDKVIPSTDAPSAHRYMQERKNFCKILIDFSSAE